MWTFWLIAAGAFLIGEIATTGFLIFWLGLGALVAMCVSFVTSNVIIQTFTFVIVSTLLIFLTKPLVNKYIVQKEMVPTNTYSLIGKTGVVISDIPESDGMGQVKIGNEIWSAVSTSGLLSKDTEIVVEKIDGVKLVVSPNHILV